MKRWVFLLLPLVIFILPSCSEEEKKEVVLEIPPEPVTKIDLHSSWVDSVYNTLSLEEQIGQLIWIEVAELNDSITSIQKEFPVGAIISNSKKHNYFQFFNQLDSLRTPVLLGTNQWQLPYTFENNAWDQNEFLSTQNTPLLSSIYDSTIHYFHDLNLHLVINTGDSTFYSNLNLLDGFQSRMDSVIQHMSDSNILSVLYNADNCADTNSELNELIYASKIIVAFNNQIQKADYSEGQLIIQGQKFNHSENSYDTIVDVLKAGEEFVLLKNINGANFKQLQKSIKQAISATIFHAEVIEVNVRKALALKEWLGLTKAFKMNEEHFDKKHIVSLRSQQYQLKHNSQILLKNDEKLIPLKDWSNTDFTWIKTGKKELNHFTKAIRNYADITASTTALKGLSLDNYSKSTPLIIVLNEQLDSVSGKLFADKVNLYAGKQQLVVVNFEYIENLKYFNAIPCLIHIWNTDQQSQELAAQAIFGGNPINGKLAFDVGDFRAKYGLTSPKTRLAYAIPEAAGFNRDSLKKVDRIAREAVYNQVTPGCQVFAARNGKVIYHQTFGYHTYERDKLVSKQDVYDIASVTKIAATTICGMKMYDEGLYKISDSLKDHLPDSLTKTLGYKSRMSNTTFKELFTHTSGLPSGLPIYKFIAYIDSVIGKFDRYYCDESDGYYCVEVAKDFYLDSSYLDSMWISMNRIWPGEKKYKYSDANMNMLYQLFRSKLREISFDRYLANQFYSPLKLRTMGYLPLQYLDTLIHPITPTEFDTFWRYQLLKGHVHDPNAALYGGVAGNAGIFSNANDLGVLFQMVMNKGTYGGKQYLTPQTINKFTSHQIDSHRGLGFDKPTYQSVSTVAPDCPTTAFGHTGFTGICVWADPENDLLFIFVSNRVHPDPSNKKIVTEKIRNRLHQVFYDQLKYSGVYKNKKYPKGYIKEPVL